MAALLRAPHPSPLAGARLHASRSPIVNSPLLHSISSSTPTGKISTSRRTLLVPLHASTNPSPPSSSNGGSMDVRRIIIRTGKILSLAFPLWISLACFLGLCKPSLFLWVHRDWQILGLTLTMLGMSMTLTLDDLKGALLMPKEIAAGFILQYTIMPLSGFFVSKMLKLPAHYAAGLILLGCCPGGTTSNIVTYLARGNVALSVLMTAASTFAAVIMTPFLTSKLAGQFVAVDPTGLFTSTVQVVLAPVILGAILNQYCNNLVEYVSPVMPFIAVVTATILCGSAIAQSASVILTSGLQVVFSVCLLHGSGFFFGYLFSRMMGIDVSSSRTISIQVGMQNSVLGLVLANQHFRNPLTAVPCAVASFIHLVYGSLLAGIWRGMAPKIERNED
ncbi:bile acid:Na+ symporter BASS family protein [Dioscorea alata]|uniref:Bile acid:Na+ symporter BASS family protein n=1 Tax=Dioscorea alata TaxID=55571 RepID=A0ACB7VMW5_DIOAL|nr:bile acid:Na+ symporter BASS family protein [Dioscorea alata]